MILIIYAHPYPRHSHANQLLLQSVETLDGVKIRSLYDLYPEFSIDVAAEQNALREANLIILQHPLHWYSVPPLLKLWMDKVLEHGWAYGQGGNALRGKDLLWAVTSGGDDRHFALGDNPGFAVLSQPIQATALYCGMNWLPYFAVHNTFICDANSITHASIRYRELLQRYLVEKNHTLPPLTSPEEIILNG